MHALRGIAGWRLRADAYGRWSFLCPGPNPIDAAGRACASKAQEQSSDCHRGGVCRRGTPWGGTVFALAMLNGSKSSDTQISVIDTGSSDEKDSSAKKKRDKSKAKESSSSDDEAVSEDESAYYGSDDSDDSDDYLTDVQTYTNDLHPYSMSIPNRFEMEDTPSGSGARYKDPETGFVINLFGYVNINEETAHEMFVDADTSGKADLYTAEGDNWYVASWREDDTIIYEKTIVTDSTIATAHLEYSTANRDMGSKIIDTLLPTFQVD